MRFVLNKKEKIGYSFGETTFYNIKHKGQDYQANYINLYAPCDCYVSTFYDNGGGNWVQFNFNNTIMQYAHLSKYIKTGEVKEGEVVAITGNSGEYTTGAHLHEQIKVNGILVNPDIYWEEVMEMTGMDDRIKEIQGIWKRLDKLESGMTDRMKEVKGIWNTLEEINKKLDNLKLTPVSPVLTENDRQSLTMLNRLIETLKTIFKTKGE